MSLDLVRANLRQITALSAWHAIWWNGVAWHASSWCIMVTKKQCCLWIDQKERWIIQTMKPRCHWFWKNKLHNSDQISCWPIPRQSILMPFLARYPNLIILCKIWYAMLCQYISIEAGWQLCLRIMQTNADVDEYVDNFFVVDLSQTNRRGQSWHQSQHIMVPLLH